jgi:integrase
VIQARLGHESISTTVDVYSHLLPDLQTAAAHAASMALNGVTTTKPMALAAS